MALAALLLLFLIPSPSPCQALSNEEIVEELRTLKNRIQRLEEEISKKDEEIAALRAEREKAEPAASPEAREQEKWTDRIEVSGAVEVEFGSEKRRVTDPATGRETSSREDDLTLSTVELGLDANLNKYSKAHVLFLYEEDEDGDRVRIDEGTIRIGGTEETYGLYFLAGKYYPHFGELNSWFVSDPLTVEIFQIRETAAEAGYESDWITLRGGGAHGDIRETGEDESRINIFFADVSIHNPEDTLGGLSLLAGASYLGNVADTDALQDENNLDLDNDGNPDMSVENQVDGLALYLVAEWERFSLGAEYITALDDFAAGEMAYALDRNGIARPSKPAAWNLEFAFRPLEPLQLAVKYEGTRDMFGLFPEKQYGLCASYELMERTTISAEYLHGEYDEDNLSGDGLTEDNRDCFTVQMAVEF